MSKTKFDVEHVLKLEAVFQNSLTGFIIIDKTGNIETINNTLAKKLQVSAQDLEGKKVDRLLNNENKSLFNEYLYYSIQQQQANKEPNTFELKINSQPGTNKYLKLVLSGTIIRDELYFVGVVKDITPEKELENKLNEKEQQKEHYKNSMEKEMAIADLKTQFVSMASHEFRSPIAGMLSSVNLIEKYIHTANKEWNQFTYKSHIEKHINVIRKALGNLQSILNEFLSMGKLDSGNLKAYVQTFNLKEFLNNYEEQVKQILKPQQPLEFHCNNCDLEIHTDKNFLHNILNNLISNAMKYSPKAKPINVNVKADKNIVKLTVEDQGKGIPKDQQSKVFDHFYRAGNVQNYSGTGLGLTITKKYVDLMHGKIYFESEEGKGSTFFVSFPVSLKSNKTKKT